MIFGLAIAIFVVLAGKAAHAGWYYTYGPGYRPHPPRKPEVPPPRYAYRMSYQEARERHARRRPNKPP